MDIRTHLAAGWDDRAMARAALCVGCAPVIDLRWRLRSLREEVSGFQWPRQASGFMRIGGARLPTWLPALGALAILTAPGLDAQIASRTDQVLARRTDKQARLWPERTSGIVKRANGYFERGFLESADMKKGANGLQFVLGGMRSGNGTTFGLGYRRIDLFNERLAFRTTVRGTPQQAYMFDLDLESPRLRYRRGDFRFYIKHENSPKMDYYGAGPNSQKSGRTSYRLEDTGIDGSGRYRLWSHLYLGASGGIYLPNVGRGQRDEVPSTDEAYRPEQVPGLDDQPKFFRAGGMMQYDYRDLATGPRSGGNYYAKHIRYWDRESEPLLLPHAGYGYRAICAVLEQDTRRGIAAGIRDDLGGRGQSGPVLSAADAGRQRIPERICTLPVLRSELIPRCGGASMVCICECACRAVF